MTMFPPELQVKQYVAKVKGKFGLHWYVYRTGSDKHYLFGCVEYPHLQFPVLKAALNDDVRSALAHGFGHGDRQVLVRVLCCPACRTEQECTWIEPEDLAEDTPEPALQLCASCGQQWEAEWPGYSYRAEAG